MAAEPKVAPSGVYDDFYTQLINCLPHLRAFARVLCRRHDMVDDLVQDAVVRALAAANQFQPGTNFKAWMFTILRNQNISTFRRQRIMPTSLDDVGFEIAQVAPQEDALVMQDLDHAVKCLSPLRREALILVVVHGLSYEEAAGICGCAVGTIKSRVARARAELHDMVLGDGETEGRGRRRGDQSTSQPRSRIRARVAALRAGAAAENKDLPRHLVRRRPQETSGMAVLPDA